MSENRRKDSTTPGMAFERPIQELEQRLDELRSLSERTDLDISSEIAAIERRLEEAIQKTYADLSAWDRVNVARHADRPVASDYIATVCDDFFELHGDKVFGDDRAMVTGLATIGARRVMLVGHRKGRTTPERLACNFGCAHPEGYRKALAKMRLAEKMGLPIVSLINTPGAYPGIGAEERGQARAIAENILAMFDLAVPILVVVIGEGGSGGALGIGVGDRVLMMEHSYYSVISPEGCAAILWKDGERTPDAAEALRLTAPDLLELRLIDGVIPEPPGGAHRNPARAMESVKQAILRELEELERVPVDELLLRRREKYRFAGEIEGRFPRVEDEPEPEPLKLADEGPGGEPDEAAAASEEPSAADDLGDGSEPVPRTGEESAGGDEDADGADDELAPAPSRNRNGVAGAARPARRDRP